MRILLDGENREICVASRIVLEKYKILRVVSEINALPIPYAEGCEICTAVGYSDSQK